MAGSNQGRLDLVIIGGGVTGCSLLYAAARYTGLQRIALVEKCADVARISSAGWANSQTLHCGDIETNYTLTKALTVKRGAAMVERYARAAPDAGKIIFKYSKMVLGVGETEIAKLKQRFDEFAPHYPAMRWLDADAIAAIEPKVVAGAAGRRPEPVAACGSTDEYCAVDFGALARSLADAAQREGGGRVDLRLQCAVQNIEKTADGFRVHTNQGVLESATVVVAAGGYSLLFARRMGYGLNYACLPVAGSFYFTPTVLNGKVYTVQNDKLPFAAVHGDPDVLVPGKTRFGPTALMLPVLERYTPRTFFDYIGMAGMDGAVVGAMWEMFRDADIREYMLRNVLYEVPLLRRRLFLSQVQKIVPSLRLEQLQFAHRVGGIRPQLIDKTTKKLLLGEAKIDPGNGIIFNMTPSPGATSCLANAEKDLEVVTRYLGVPFDRERWTAELG